MGKLRIALTRVPRTAWLCALIACLNAACWSFISPPFQVVDEPSHFAYVQNLAETGTLPASAVGAFSEEEELALRDLGQHRIMFNPTEHTISSTGEQQQLQRDLAVPLSSRGSGYAGVASTEPPLYYAFEAIPYTLAGGGSILDRLELMRLFSSLLAGFTTLFAFLFIRETLPAEPWAWTVGGLATALLPLLAFISGAVNPDALLFAVSAAVFYLLARGFRRGLDTRLAIVLGIAIAAGFLAKLNFLGLAPGVFLGLLLLTLRAARSSRRAALRCFALTSGIGLAPVALYLVINLLSNHPAFGLVSGAVNTNTTHGTFTGRLSYIWQLFLPRLPGMGNDFPGVFPLQQYWFNGLVGLYGWLDTQFPSWFYSVALIPAGFVVLLAGRAILAARAALKSRVSEPLVYLTMAVGLMGLIGTDGYFTFPEETAVYSEARYLLPLLALYGTLLALAARGAGRRWGPALGTLIVVMALGHDILSQLLVISRYYG
jgi:4-amino-4-deoxy-L-arabinose transferase-like glycosyltransferase